MPAFSARRIAISANMTMPLRSAAFNNMSAGNCHAGIVSVAGYEMFASVDPVQRAS